MSSARFIGKVSKHSALTSTETVAFIKDGEKGVCVCVWGGGGGGGQGEYIPIATLSPPE